MSQAIWTTISQVTLASHPMRLAAIMIYADSRSDYETQLQAFASTAQVSYSYQLAPLPLSAFLTRHGRTELLSVAQQLQLGEVKIVYLDEVPVDPPLESVDYLLRHLISEVTPLDSQFGRSPKLFAPDEISKLLWPNYEIPANMFDRGCAEPQPVFSPPASDEKVNARDRKIFGDVLPPLNCYMVVDAARHWLFPPSHTEYRCESLYQGLLAKKAKESAPYLVEVIPDEMSELLGLFSTRDSLIRYSWEDNLGIFIHSRHDFETVRTHLRRFVAIRNESDTWYFFRFYDPVVLRQYLEAIATNPEKLTRFFGYEERIIHAFASGYDDSFHYYSLKALPDNVQPAPIVMTDWELEGLVQQRWLISRANLVGYIMQEYPHITEPTDKTHLVTIFNDAFEKGYTNEIALTRYVLAKLNADKKQLDFDSYEKQIDQEQRPSEIKANLLWYAFMQGENDVR